MSGHAAELESIIQSVDVQQAIASTQQMQIPASTLRRLKTLARISVSNKAQDHTDDAGGALLATASLQQELEQIQEEMLVAMRAVTADPTEHILLLKQQLESHGAARLTIDEETQIRKSFARAGDAWRSNTALHEQIVELIPRLKDMINDPVVLRPIASAVASSIAENTTSRQPLLDPLLGKFPQFLGSCRAGLRHLKLDPNDAEENEEETASAQVDDAEDTVEADSSEKDDKEDKKGDDGLFLDMQSLNGVNLRPASKVGYGLTFGLAVESRYFLSKFSEVGARAALLSGPISATPTVEFNWHFANGLYIRISVAFEAGWEHGLKMALPTPTAIKLRIRGAYKPVTSVPGSGLKTSFFSENTLPGVGYKYLVKDSANFKAVVASASALIEFDSKDWNGDWKGFSLGAMVSAGAIMTGRLSKVIFGLAWPLFPKSKRSTMPDFMVTVSYGFPKDVQAARKTVKEGEAALTRVRAGARGDAALEGAVVAIGEAQKQLTETAARAQQDLSGFQGREDTGSLDAVADAIKEVANTVTIGESAVLTAKEAAAVANVDTDTEAALREVEQTQAELVKQSKDIVFSALTGALTRLGIEAVPDEQGGGLPWEELKAAQIALDEAEKKSSNTDVKAALANTKAAVEAVQGAEEAVVEVLKSASDEEGSEDTINKLLEGIEEVKQARVDAQTKFADAAEKAFDTKDQDEVSELEASMREILENDLKYVSTKADTLVSAWLAFTAEQDTQEAEDQGIPADKESRVEASAGDVKAVAEVAELQDDIVALESQEKSAENGVAQAVDFAEDQASADANVKATLDEVDSAVSEVEGKIAEEEKVEQMQSAVVAKLEEDPAADEVAAEVAAADQAMEVAIQDVQDAEKDVSVAIDEAQKAAEASGDQNIQDAVDAIEGAEQVEERITEKTEDLVAEQSEIVEDMMAAPEAGDSAVGDSAVGDSEAGDSAVGDSEAGDSEAGDSEADSKAADDSAVGDSEAGDSAVGDSEAGDSEAGDSEAGDSEADSKAADDDVAPSAA